MGWEWSLPTVSKGAHWEICCWLVENFVSEKNGFFCIVSCLRCKKLTFSVSVTQLMWGVLFMNSVGLFR